MYKCIITGGTGIVGLSLISKLLRENCKVLALVRNKPERLLDYFDNSNLEVKETCLNNLHNMVTGEEYDSMYHLAWEGTRGETRLDKEKQENNVNMTLNVLKLANELGCKRFIATGSQAEYGICSGKISENKIINPNTPYGIAKVKACEESRKLADSFNIKHVWTRIFSLYGPHDYEKTLISSLIISMLQNEDINVTECKQIWDYLYVEDCVSALYEIGKSDYNKSGIYNLGSGMAKPLKEYVETIKAIIDSTSQINYGKISYTKDSVMHLEADISKIKKEIGWIPKIIFDRGIRETVEYWKKEMKI